jgi:hypothetical protein
VYAACPGKEKRAVIVGPSEVFPSQISMAEEVISMKTCLLAFLSLCFGVGIVAVAQSPNQAPGKHQAAVDQSTSIIGTVSEQGEKLRLVTDQKIWRVDNPEILKGHEGHYVRVNAHVYPQQGLIHIREVNMPTASESRENDARSHRSVCLPVDGPRQAGGGIEVCF